MKVDLYVKTYTSGHKVFFKHIISELKEFVAELVKLNSSGIKEEMQDVIHFTQLWLYWRFGLNGNIWKITNGSVNKFMNRKKVWQKLYKDVGLNENISNFCGNYNKPEKVIKQLSKFGVTKERSMKAYNKIVLTLQ